MLAAKRSELQLLTQKSFGQRALSYSMACFASQTFWTAALIYAVTAGVADLAGLFF